MKTKNQESNFKVGDEVVVVIAGLQHHAVVTAPDVTDGDISNAIELAVSSQSGAETFTRVVQATEIFRRSKIKKGGKA